MTLAFSDIEKLLPLAFAMLYILGKVAAIFHKRKKGDQLPDSPADLSKSKHPAPPRPARPQPPTPPRALPVPPGASLSTTPPVARPRAPQPPHAPRPAPTARMQARPAPQPEQQRQRPAARAPSPPPARAARRPQPAVDVVLPAQPDVIPETKLATQARERAAREKSESTIRSEKRSARGSAADQLRRVLLRPSGFRAAFLLSELLAQPVALREQHLEDR